MSAYILFLVGFVYILVFYLFTIPKSSSRGSMVAFAKARLLAIGGIVETVVVSAQLINPRLFTFTNEPVAWLQISGIAFFVLGLIIITGAKLTMGQYWAMPGKVKDNQKKLVTTGLFKLSRNPIYVGRIIMILGFEIGLQSWLVLILVPDIVATHFIVRDEEKSLIQKFGSTYIKYMKEVPRYF